ncbi:hypothetical protein J1N35_025656 [Gossypium stocksii]|uniref:Uncharacterized protein n=1 Tax=Gossypium stocksii TaxID=47602 RepID=A0A9D3V815_9ROSI|nr:hypothetical protein J1N35_025656 [Gossypium stocksii]
MLARRLGELEFTKRLGELVYASRFGKMVYSSKTGTMVYASRTGELVFDNWSSKLVFASRLGKVRIASRPSEVRIASRPGELGSPVRLSNFQNGLKKVVTRKKLKNLDQLEWDELDEKTLEPKDQDSNVETAGKKWKNRGEKYDKEEQVEEGEEKEHAKRAAIEKPTEEVEVKEEEEGGEAGKNELVGIPISPGENNKNRVIFVLENASFEVAKVGKVHGTWTSYCA